MDYWSLLEPYWGAISFEDADSFLTAYAELPDRSRHLFATHWLYSEVCNGGFHQFFTNPAGIVAPEAVVGFQALNLLDLAEISANAMNFFQPSFPRDQILRIKLLESYAESANEDVEDDWNPFNALDDQFYAGLALSTSSDDRFVIAANAYAGRQ